MITTVTFGTSPQMVRQASFLRLLELAFASLDGREPVVVATEDNGPIGLKHAWRSHSTSSPSDLADSATGLLRTAPVLLIPPWGRTSGRSTVAPVDSALRTIHEIVVAGTRPSGAEDLLAALLPTSALTAPSSRTFREIVDQSWQPCLIVFAAGIFAEVHERVEAAAIFWRPRSLAPPPLKLFRLPRHERGEVAETDLRRLLNRVSGSEKFGYVLPRPPDSGESLSIELNDPVLTARWSELHVWGTTTRLGDLFSFPAPALHQAADRRMLKNQQQDGLVRVVSGRDLRHDGTVAGSDDSSRWAEVSQEQQLRAGDILLRRIFSPQSRNNLRVAEVAANDLPLAADNTVVILRADAHLGGPQRLVAVLFLRSPLVRRYAAGLSIADLAPSILSDLRIPQPDAALAATLEGLESARSQLENWKNESEAILESVFEDESAVTARRRILVSGRRLRMRVEAAALLDDFSHQVRTRYPYPIAYRWSDVQVLLSRGLHEAAYEAILEAGEVLLCYAALVVLSLSSDKGLRLGAVGGIRRRLSRGGTNGPGFGDWATILQEAAESRAFRRIPDGDPLTDISRAFAGPEATSARLRLAQRRNDKAHLRRVDAIDLPSAIQEAHADLRSLLEQASFLADMPFVHVTGLRWDALKRIAQVEYEELMGDIALVPSRQRLYASNDLEVGSLYLGNEDGRLHLLRPYLLRRRCPICRSWETFHVDNAPDASTVAVKSLERGHADVDPALRQVLEHAGLLES